MILRRLISSSREIQEQMKQKKMKI